MNNKDSRMDDQEIDLSKLKQKMSSAVDGMNTRIFRILQFIVKNIIVIVVLFIIGAGLGFYMDKKQMKYESNIIVTPNFGSVDYMYTKLELLNAKIKERDTVFLKAIGVNDPKKLLGIEVEPISDIFSFVAKRESNLSLVKMIADDSGMNKLLLDPTTSKNFKYHKITFVTLSETNLDKTVKPILKYLNNSNYFSRIQSVELNTITTKINSITQTIEQIDGFLNQLSSNSGSQNPKSLVYFSENGQLNDVIESKERLVVQRGLLTIDKVTSDAIIKESSTMLNIRNTSLINGKMKLILPLLFIILFIFSKKFVLFYKRQSLKLKETTVV